MNAGGPRAARRAALAGIAIAAAVFALYTVTLCRGPFPGESARLLAQHADLDPFPPLSRPLWHLAVQTLARLPFGTLALRAAVFSALCGAATVGLLYALLRRLGFAIDEGPYLAHGTDNVIDEDLGRAEPQPRPDEPPDTARHFVLAARREGDEGAAAAAAGESACFGAAAGAFFLALCAPFWVVATRAHPAAFDAVLLLSCALLAHRHARTGRLGALYAAAALAGLAVAESPPLAFVVPGIAVFGVVALFRQGQFAVRRVALGAALGLAGLLVHLLVAWRFSQHPASEWRELGGFGPSLLQVLREQYYHLRWSVPSLGWLLVLILAALPALLAALAHRAVDADVRAWMAAAGLLVLATGFVLLYNASIAPWRMFGWWPLLVTPYVLAAASFGWTAGWLHHALRRGLFRHGEPGGLWHLAFLGGLLRPVEETNDPRRRALASGAFAAAILAAVGGAGAANLAQADGRRAAPFGEFARRVLRDAGDRPWIALSGGDLDEVLRLAAHDARHPAQPLNLYLARYPAYRRRLAGQVGGVRLRAAAETGPEAFIREWLASDRDLPLRAAVVDVPDLWTFGGWRPVPRGLVYDGAREAEVPDPEASLERHRANRGFLAAWARDAAAEPEPMRSTCAAWLRSGSRAANDLAVLLERRGRVADAMAVYADALRIAPDNVSALLNRAELAARAGRPEAPALRREVDAYIRRLARRLDAAQTVQVYGTLTHPAAAIERGGLFAAHGQIDAALAELREAERAGADPLGVETLAAGLLLGAGQEAAGEEKLRAVLAARPGDPAALAGLLNVTLRGGRWDEAEALAGELARVPGQERPAALVRALVAIVRDRRPEARRLLDAVLAARPDDPAAWVLRTWLAIDERDDAATARGLAQLRRQMPGRPDVAEAVGRLEAARGDLAAARATLEELLREAPQRAGAWEQLLRIDHAERRQDLAEEHVRRLLEVDPRSEVGNQFLASLQIARGRFVEAEGTLRRLIETRRSAGALNDLAWALREQGRARDAEPFADEAVRLDPASWAAQDTLGAVRMDLGRFGEARAALAEASRLSHGHPAVVQRMVELEEKVERARASR